MAHLDPLLEVAASGAIPRTERPHPDACPEPQRPRELARRAGPPGLGQPRPRRPGGRRADPDDPRPEGRDVPAPQRPERHPARGPHHAVRRRQPVVQGRLEGREDRPDRLRPPVRAPDVPGVRAPRQRILRPARKARRPDQREHEQRPDELLRGPPHQRPRNRPLARSRPDGVPPAGPDAGEARQPARRRQERAAAAGRQRPLRPGAGEDRAAPVSARAPVLPLGHRVAGRPLGRQPERRQRLLPDVLQPEQRQPLPRRRHQPDRSPGADRQVLRPDPPRPRGRQARRGRPDARRVEVARHDRRRPALPRDARLADRAAGPPGRGRARRPGRDPGAAPQREPPLSRPGL